MRYNIVLLALLLPDSVRQQAGARAAAPHRSEATPRRPREGARAQAYPVSTFLVRQIIL